MEQTGSPGILGFLLHSFPRERHGQTVVCGMGRLETGETFALADDRKLPAFHVRVSDRARAQALAAPFGVRLLETERTTMDGESVARVETKRVSILRQLAQRLAGEGIRTYEADLNFVRLYLMDQGLRGSLRLSGPWRPGTGVDRVYLNPSLAPAEWEPTLAVLSLDIETDSEASRIYAISLVGTGPEPKHGTEEIHLVGSPSPDDGPELTCYPDERSLLEALPERFRAVDPDVLTGWNLIDFDLVVLQRRFSALGVPFNLGRTQEASWYREGEVWGGSRMVIYGRQVLDALHLARVSLERFDDNRLETVAQAVLGRGKTLEAEDDETAAAAIERAYREDRRAFAEYCLEDARLVSDILAARGLIELTLRRSLLTGLSLEQCWGSVAPFEFLYAGELHRRDMVAPSLGVDRRQGHGAPGGLVMEPQPGLYRQVLVFDFKSLYPSIIRTFNIDPLALIRARRQDATDPDDVIVAPNGARFDRDPGILPGLLERFFASRAEARARGDELASFTYKILMNSFYGVLATDACRFADDELAGAITEFGHHLLRWTRDLLEGEGCRVLYGDTDSVFVDAGLAHEEAGDTGRARGEELCAWVNEQLRVHLEEEYSVQSYLELEFERHYRRFLLPPTRSGERGRAKGYAGLWIDRAGEHLEIVGMEAVRRDWTDMAHGLQRDLLARVFHDASTEEIEACVSEWIRAVRTGEKDADLVYHKGLRKPVSAYTRSAPPHVQAARLLPNPAGVIHYVVTTQGPQPVGHVTARPDYDHYVEKQIAPLTQVIAQVCDIDLDGVVKGAPSLFGRPGRG